MYLFYNPLVGSWQNQSSSTSILIRPSIKKPPAPSAFQIPSPVKPSAGVNWIAPIFGILARSTLVRKAIPSLYPPINLDQIKQPSLGSSLSLHHKLHRKVPEKKGSTIYF
ncbi:uncharacterized protein TrAtP1_007839 [Trichoderma atroviride]|uniref:uncharacterized protein n=1 Tax=Hypocrea atroviridis TaxID=63577 RepID=UPI003317FE63|nr:hypothetical protein TrAtP1_007839 [Trichoderma atroviride]